jgi:hypothetical protein
LICKLLLHLIPEGLLLLFGFLPQLLVQFFQSCCQILLVCNSLLGCNLPLHLNPQVMHLLFVLIMQSLQCSLMFSPGNL